MSTPTLPEPDYKSLLNRLIDEIDQATNHTRRLIVLDAVTRQYPAPSLPPGDVWATGILRGLTEAHNRVRFVVQEIASQLPAE